MAEEGGGLATAALRQLLRGRRPLSVAVMDPAGCVLFRAVRPPYLLASCMRVVDGSGTLVGEVRQRWHLWRRQYDLYVGQRQFAAIRSGLLAWEFVLQDEGGRPLARIDRNFSGLGREFFTDAGTYVVHFGSALGGGAKAPGASRAQVNAAAVAAGGSGDSLLGGWDEGWQAAQSRQLTLTERAITLAAAVSIDCDYFSRSAGGGGGLLGGGGLIFWPSSSDESA